MSTRPQSPLPDRSPLKDAQKHNLDDASEDELLLSPNKAPPPKRAASLDPWDQSSTFSPHGREPKRVKRDLSSLLQLGNSARPSNATQHGLQPIRRRSTRQRPRTATNKPLSTVSDTPASSGFTTSASLNKGKGRAQSVPLFPSTADIPWIDLRNPPPSPKRSKSPVRSPSKERLRITHAAPSVPHAMLNGQKEHADSIQPTIEHDILSQQPEMAVDPSFAMAPASSLPSTSASPPTVPATPVTLSLNRLIPMSPLTPIPETPLPAKTQPMKSLTDRLADGTGWSIIPSDEIDQDSSKPPPPARPPVPSTRMPLPSEATTLPKPIVQSWLPAVATKKPTATAGASKKVAKPPVKDAFALLMKKPNEDKARQQAKFANVRQLAQPGGSKLPSAPFVFAVPKAKEVAVAPSEAPKKKMKEKMKPREKQKALALPMFIPLKEDDEEGNSTIVEIPSDQLLPVKEQADPSAESSRAVNRDALVGQDVSMLPPSDEAQLQSERRNAVPVNPEEDANNLETVGHTSDMPHDNNVMEVDAPTSEGIQLLDQDRQIQSTLLEQDAPLSAESRPVTQEIALLSEADSPDGSQGVASIETKTTEGEVPHPAPVAGPSKPALGKKRQPIDVAQPNRVTRSVSKQKEKAQPQALAPDSHIPPKKPSTLKRAASVSKKKQPIADPPKVPKVVNAGASTDSVEKGDIAYLGSPMKISSPPKITGKSLGATEHRTLTFGAGKLTLAATPTKKTFNKPASTPSPTKIARATSLFLKPTISSLARTSSYNFGQPATATGSSSSTLSNALEKLRMPAPSRPSTSMGFNHDLSEDGDNDSEPLRMTKDDNAVGRTLSPKRPVSRSATLGPSAFRATTTSTQQDSTGVSSTKALVQKPVSAFFSAKGAAAVTRTSTMMRGGGRVAGGLARPAFGAGGAIRRTLSRKTSLPKIMGSPVKGRDTTMVDYPDEEDDPPGQTNAESNAMALSQDGPESENVPESTKPIPETPLPSGSESLPSSKSLGLMGPPATPTSGRQRARSNTTSSIPAISSDGSPSAGPSSSGGTRSSARIAKAAPAAASVQAEPGSSNKNAPVPEAMKILKDCVIFVDVKTDDGEEAGSLFVEMLDGLGAKILTRVGQTCTHIVYKNGLMSTFTRYRLLRDPKPLVVSIGWVVECVEQRRQVEEARFIVDLDEVNVANKRRRSILPRLLSEPSGLTFNDTATSAENVDGGECDQSMDGSTSSISVDEDLTPLERARRRKSLLFGPRT